MGKGSKRLLQFHWRYFASKSGGVKPDLIGSCGAVNAPLKDRPGNQCRIELAVKSDGVALSCISDTVFNHGIENNSEKPKPYTRRSIYIHSFAFREPGFPDRRVPPDLAPPRIDLGTSCCFQVACSIPAASHRHKLPILLNHRHPEYSWFAGRFILISTLENRGKAVQYF